MLPTGEAAPRIRFIGDDPVAGSWTVSSVGTTKSGGAWELAKAREKSMLSRPPRRRSKLGSSVFLPVALVVHLSLPALAADELIPGKIAVVKRGKLAKFASNPQTGQPFSPSSLSGRELVLARSSPLSNSEPHDAARGRQYPTDLLSPETVSRRC